jgi:hypothetical protein
VKGLLEVWPLASLGAGGLVAAAQAAVPVPDTISGVEKVISFGVVAGLLIAGITALWMRMLAMDKATNEQREKSDKAASEERERWRVTLDKQADSLDNVARSITSLDQKINGEMRSRLDEIARHKGAA